jgi:hypothetical protein
VRQKLREKNNDLPPNDPNHDEKPPINTERPLCKCDLDCQSHMSLEYDMYDMRYLVLPSAHLSVPLGLGQGEAEEGSFSSTFTLHIVNIVIIDRYIFL